VNTVYRQTNEPRTDWFRILADLAHEGIGNRGVARRVCVAKTTVIGWKNHGHEPKHSDGERLIALWCEVKALEREHVPTRNPFDWR